MLHVSLFGEQAITDDGTGRVRTRSSRTAALVGFLVTRTGSPQARQRIAGLFWPDSAEAQALTNLRRELHHLRQVLGDDPALVVTPRDLCWYDTATCRVDVRIFATEREAALAAGSSDQVLAHADRAIAQYKGDFLPGAYDDWLLESRAALERQCVELCDLVCQTRTATGDLAGAVGAARRRIGLAPLEEAGYRTLMRLQADLGDRAGALSTYHHCASVLERELGVTPDRTTRKTFERLMARAESVPPGRPAAAGSLPAARSGRAAAQLVGRSRELGQLTDLWRAASAGRPGLALVRGVAGVGKSRLVAEIAGMARQQGAVVASTQCFGTSGRLALAPVADWLRNPAIQSAVDGIDHAWRAEVGRLVPARGHSDPGAGSRIMADAWQHHRFFEGLARALLAAARPLLLVLDNLQWCDQETLAFITFCLGLDPSARFLVIASLRDDSPDGDHESAGWTMRMRASGLLTELPLSPLEAADTGRLAEAISGHPLPEADVQLLQATTGGFPLYVTEAVRDGVDLGRISLPGGDLAAVLRSRLSHPGAAAREVAGLAAAVGTNFTLDLLTEASDLDADAVVEAIDELWRRRIMREFGDGYDFSHDLLRETAYAQISPPKRWLLHRRIAQGLELLHADDADAVSAQLADQYARGGRPGRAVSYYRRAAGVAADRFAYAESIRLHQDALSMVRSLPEGRDRDSRELELLEAIAAPLNARHGYASPDLQRTLERSVTLAESLGRRDSTLTALVALWTTRFVQGRNTDGDQIANRALALTGAGTESSGPAHFAVGGAAFSLGRLAEAVHHLELAATLASGQALSTGTRPDVLATSFASHAHWLLGHDEAALDSSRRSIALARAIGNPYHLVVAVAYDCVLHQLRRDLTALQASLPELRGLCERYEFAYYQEWGLILDGWSRPDGSGVDLARRGIENLRSSGSMARMPYWLSLLADLLARGGQAGAARATLDAALTTGRAHDELWWLPEVMRMRAAYDDDDTAATARLRSAAQLATDRGSLALVQRCEQDLARRSHR
jgi:DNA-binding SARP family transcriptional activator/tetratricopeptide (TPR) repeat protein